MYNSEAFPQSRVAQSSIHFRLTPTQFLTKSAQQNPPIKEKICKINLILSMEQI